jgi:DNA-binding CsgD family transcriptional regulator/tetratricopeptide (TPR) repeat protein
MRRRLSCPELVGRGEELAFLGEAFERAVAGHPSVALVGGEAGVGKTRLMHELAATVRRSGARVWTGYCPPHGEHVMPYAPIVQILQGAIPSLDAALVRELTRHAADLIPALAPESAESGAARPVTMDNHLQSRQWSRLLRMLNDVAGDPTLIVVEDLHWADSSTRGLLGLLAHGLTGRLLVVCTYRDDELRAAHPLRPVLTELHRAGALRVPVRRLDAAETVAQVAGILGEQPTAAVAERVFRRSGGNAFLVEELLASGDDGPTLAPDLRDVLLTRVRQLPDAARLAVRAVALAGRTVEHALLAEALGLPATELNPPLEHAVECYVLVPEGDGYTFRHALVAEAVLADTLPGERIRLHAMFGAAFDARLARGGPLTPTRAALLAEAAHHWLAAGDSTRALPVTVDAALAAERTYAVPEAFRLFRRALQLWWDVPDGSRRSALDLPDLYWHAAHAAFATGAAEDAVTHVRQALDEIDERADPLRAAVLLSWQGRYLQCAGHPLTATLRAFETATRLVPEEPTRERAEVLAAHARMIMMTTRWADAADLATTAVSVARQVGARADEAHAVGTLGSCLAMLGDSESGLVHLREALSISTQIGDRIGVWRMSTNLSDVLFHIGSLTEAADVALAAMVTFRDGGLSPEQHDSLLGNGLEPLFWLGRWDELAERLDERFSGHAGPALGPGVRSVILLPDVALRTARGDFDGAALRLDRCRDLIVGSYVDMGGVVQACQAELDLWRGRPDLALDTATRGIEQLATGQHHVLIGRLLAAAARACADLAATATAATTATATAATTATASTGAMTGRTAADPGRVRIANRLATHIARVRDAGPLTRLAEAHLTNAEGELARLVGGEHARLTWEHAAGRWQRLRAPYPVAYARWRQAEALLTEPGHRTLAARALGEAVDAAATLGAEPLREEILALARRARLPAQVNRQTSDRPSPVRGQPAMFGLTAREEEVLVRIAHGDTNREIAQNLFISESTVSIHVTRIFAKIGVTNRATAAVTAHRLGLAGNS